MAEPDESSVSADILTNLSIQRPETSNPIHFSSMVPMDYDLAEILRRNLSHREIKVGLPPEARELEEAVRSQAGELEKQDLRMAAEAFRAEWDVYDADAPDVRRSNWRYTDGNLVEQTETTGLTPPDQSYGFGTVAVSEERMEDGANRVELTLRPGANNDAGLVFNFRDVDDYWILSIRRVPEEGTLDSFAVLRVEQGQMSLLGEQELSANLGVVDVTLSVSSEQLLESQSLRLELLQGEESAPVLLSVPAARLVAGSGIGLYTRLCGDASFRGLRVDYSNSSEALVPAPGRSRWRVASDRDLWATAARSQFESQWTVHDPPGEHSNWRYRSDEAVVQTYSTGSSFGEGGLGTIAISPTPISEDSGVLTLRFSPGAENEAGLVFNFIGEDNYYVLSYRRWGSPAKSRAALLKKTGQHFVRESELEVPDCTGRTLEIVVGQSGGIVLKGTLSDPWESDVVLPFGESLSKSTGVGFYSRFNDDAQFIDLRVRYEGETSREVILIPEPVSSADASATNGTGEYQRKFSYEVIDLRPIEWLETAQLLYQERAFVRNRYDRARTAYDNPPVGDTDERAVEGAEARYRRAFIQRQRVERRYDDFSAFLTAQGVAIADPPPEANADPFGEWSGTIEIQDEQVDVSTWTEWKIRYRVQIPYHDVDNEYLNTVRHGTFLKTQLGLYRVYYFDRGDYHRILQNELPAYPDVDVTDRSPYALEYGRCHVIEKYAEAKSTTTVTQVVETQELTGNLFRELHATIRDRVRKALALKDESGERELRHYQFVNGEFLDQYGVALYDHVIEINENPTKTEDRLVVSVPGKSETDGPSKLVVYTNPAFSGRQIHPPTVLFEEHYVLGVTWTGIGLGEFSHSVNLFPGEQRELEIKTTKKRSWKTTRSSTATSKAGSTSETGTVSKRVDTFDSKLQDAFEDSTKLNAKDSSETSETSTSSMSIEASGGLFGIGIAAGVKTGDKSTSGSTSSTEESIESVSKSVTEIASKTSNEVSQNNKVAFSTSSTDTLEATAEETAEDNVSETHRVSVSNINEGKTVNYNFFQVTNTYETLLKLSDVTMTIDTGIEIIPGSGITIAKTYDLENFGDIVHDLRVYPLSVRSEITKGIAAQILKRYVFFEGVDEEDISRSKPRILRIRDNALSTEQLRVLREECERIFFDEAAFNPASWKSDTDSAGFHQPFPDLLLEFAAGRFYIQGFQVGSADHYTVNSGKYYVDAQVGLMPATEDYLEARRAIETERQRMLVEELRARTEAGIFFPEFPEGLTSLSTDGMPGGDDTGAESGSTGATESG